MTEDLKIILDEASASGSPPIGFDADAVVHKGRQRVRRTRLALTGGALTAFTAVLAAAVVLGGGGNGTPAAAPTIDVSPSSSPSPSGGPSPDIGELDPAGDYHWTISGRKTDETGEFISDTLLTYFAANYPGAKVVTWEHGQGNDLVALDADDSPFRISRFAGTLTAADPEALNGAPSSFPAAIYSTWPALSTRTSPIVESDDPLDFSTGVQLVMSGDGRDKTDALRIAVFPPGSFNSEHDPSPSGASSASNGSLIPGCDRITLPDRHNYGYETTVEYTCGISAGVNGALIRTAEQVWTYGPTGTRTYRTAVIYRADGTAVVVSSNADVPVGWHQGDGVPDDPFFDAEALTRIASAIPPVSFH